MEHSHDSRPSTRPGSSTGHRPGTGSRVRARRPRREDHQDPRHGRREGHSAGRPRRRDRGRRVHRDHGPVRLGQVDPDALSGGPGLSGRRPDLDRRHRAHRAARARAHRAAPRPDRLHFPVVQPHPGLDRPGEHHPADGDRGPHARPGLAQRDRDDLRPDGPAAPPALGTVRRAAAAGRLCSRPRGPAGDRVRRRAHGEPGLPGRDRGAAAAAQERGRARTDRRHGDPRPDRRVLRRPRGLPRRRPGGRRAAVPDR